MPLRAIEAIEMNARLTWPSNIKTGDVVKLRLLIQHPMETGYLQDFTGHYIPRNVIQWIKATYDQKEVFNVQISSGIAANPFFEFYIKATVTGLMVVKWLDDAGEEGEIRQLLPVKP
jgi:sulfur-oxidizing protein SoxZ